VRGRIITGSIRSGKTYRACQLISDLVKEGYKAIVLAPSHEIVGEITRKLDNFGLRVIHMAGVTNRNIDYNVDNSMTPRVFYQEYSKGNLQSRIGTVEKLLNESYDVVATVPQIGVLMNPVDVLFLDEFLSIDFFHLNERLIYEIKKKRGRIEVYNFISEILPILTEKSKKYVLIKAILEWAQHVSALLDEITHIVKENNIERLDEVQNEIESTCMLWSRFMDKVKEDRKLNEELLYLVSGIVERAKTKFKDKESEEELAELLVSLLWSNLKVSPRTSHRVKVFAIPVVRKLPFFEKWLKAFKEIIIAINEELKNDAIEFMKYLNTNPEITELEFKYSDHFNIFVTENLLALGKELYRNGVPVFWVTSKKDRANELRVELRENGVPATVIDYHTKEEIEEMAMRGEHVVVYLNSRVSKGVDLPFFNVVLVDSYHFTSPRSIGDFEGYIRDLISELWQTILRCTPTPNELSYPKFVVFKTVNWRSKYEQEYVSRITKKKRVIKSNWLPNQRIKKEPIFMSWKKLCEVILYFVPHVKRSAVTDNHLVKRRRQKSFEIKSYKIKRVEYRTHVNKAAISKYFTLVSLIGDQNASYASLAYNFDLEGFFRSISHKEYDRDAIWNIFRSHGLRDVNVMNKILKSFERIRLVEVSSKNRGKIYRFKSLDVDKILELSPPPGYRIPPESRRDDPNVSNV